MLKIILSGCNGRMGQMITSVVAGRDDMEIVAGIDVNNVRLSNYPVYQQAAQCTDQADAVVDFSAGTALEGILAYCKSRNLPVVLCTTGYSVEQVEAIKAASRDIPVLRSGNMSLGVNLLMELVRNAARTLGADFDIEIIEKHHNQKKDAPSGTALMLADAAREGREEELELVCGRSGASCKRQPGEIGISAMRGGTIVGEHSVIFAGNSEIIELKHSALSRELFATGALRAAAFLANKSAGLYSMADVVAEAE
ncbi:MAG: 4-hydroxy-tetrahydrodipicolinate reductase [Oscillospiraceae bacterium]|nr:4-hydroxy-tetrahydrodipicolinate reductase [Oscillospiraceae bacterium]